MARKYISDTSPGFLEDLLRICYENAFDPETNPFNPEKIAESMSERLRTDSSGNALKEVKRSLISMGATKAQAVAVRLLQGSLPIEVLGDIDCIARQAVRHSLQDPLLPTEKGKEREGDIKLSHDYQAFRHSLQDLLLSTEEGKEREDDVELIPDDQARELRFTRLLPLGDFAKSTREGINRTRHNTRCEVCPVTTGTALEDEPPRNLVGDMLGEGRFLCDGTSL